MSKKSLLLAALLGVAASSWVAKAGPYIGEEAIGWQTTSAVTVNSSDNGGWFGVYGVAGLVNGGAFQANGQPGSKVPFAGAAYTTDGWRHTTDPGSLTWITADIAAKTSPSGINCQAWVQFSFDTVYSINNISVWNSGMANGAAPGRSWKDAVISWSTDGSVWSSMNYTFNQYADYDAIGGGNFFAPSDPSVAFAHDAKYVVFSGLNTYGGTEYMMSEVRFNLVPEPSTFALLGLGALGLLLRRKS